jgi:hypothetical protein
MNVISCILCSNKCFYKHVGYFIKLDIDKLLGIEDVNKKSGDILYLKLEFNKYKKGSSKDNFEFPAIGVLGHLKGQ